MLAGGNKIAAIFRRLLKLNWVAVVLFPLTVILMEVFWLYPWLAWVGQWPAFTLQRPPLSLTSLILLMSVSFFATRFFLSQGRSLRWIRLSIVSCGLATIFILVRVEYGAGFGILSGSWFVYTGRIFLNSFSQPHQIVVALAVAAYIWWRGIRLGRCPLYFDDVYRSFLIGLTALAVLTIVWRVGLRASSIQSLMSTVGLHVTGFFLFGLNALALSHLRTIQQKLPEKEDMTAILSRRWLYITLGVVGGILLAGIGTASIFSADFVALLGRLGNLIYGLLLQVLHYLFIPIGYVAEGLFYVIQAVLSLLRSRQSPQSFQSDNLSAIEGLPEKVTPLVLSPEALMAIKWGVFALIAGVTIFLITRAIFRHPSLRVGADTEESHESLWSWEGFKADLHLFFSMVWQSLKPKKKRAMPGGSIPSWYRRKDVPRVLSIREIYRHLLWEASCCRITRGCHETPYEYESRLAQAMPDGSEPLRELTNLYINFRYGDLAPRDKQIDFANSLWRTLRGMLQKLRGNQAE